MNMNFYNNGFNINTSTTATQHKQSE